MGSAVYWTFYCANKCHFRTASVLSSTHWVGCKKANCCTFLQDWMRVYWRINRDFLLQDGSGGVLNKVKCFTPLGRFAEWREGVGGSFALQRIMELYHILCIFYYCVLKSVKCLLDFHGKAKKRNALSIEAVNKYAISLFAPISGSTLHMLQWERILLRSNRWHPLPVKKIFAEIMNFFICAFNHFHCVFILVIRFGFIVMCEQHLECVCTFAYITLPITMRVWW